MFGKQTEKKQPEIQSSPRFEPYDIHVMPPKFHKYLAVKKGGFGRFALIFVVAIVVLGALGAGAWYLYQQMGKTPATNINQPAPSNLNQANKGNVNTVSPNANVNANENANANANENNNNNVNFNANENTNQNVNVNVNTNVNANENVNANVNVNENINANVNAAPQPVTLNYSSSADADNDQLTDVEEELYGTERRKPDTDEDGYLDSQEVINLFNPKAAGASLLETSGIVNKYTNPIFNYEILHLSAWLARPNDQSLTEVIFQSATGEYVEVIVEDNPQKLDLVQWYVATSPMADLNQLKRGVTKQGYDVLYSPDRLSAYVQSKDNPDKIYVITYNIGNKVRVNFLTTFSMMINSFKLLAPAQP